MPWENTLRPSVTLPEEFHLETDLLNSHHKKNQDNVAEINKYSKDLKWGVNAETVEKTIKAVYVLHLFVII